MATQEKRGMKTRTLTGLVTSDKMDKTIVVTVARRMKHAQYHKYIGRKKKYKAHDAKNEAKIGDRVEIRESAPISKDKHWTLNKVIERAA